MTQSRALDDPMPLAASSADPFDDVFEQSDRAAKEPREQSNSAKRRKTSRGWPVAIIASIVWIMTVAAFCWSRYSLPNDASAALDVVGSRISTGDWFLIAAAILGPLLLIWLAAWLIRRSSEMREESRQLATAALRLARAAQNAENGSALALTSSGIDGEMTEERPRHLRREVERATHAISALHSQMHAIEEALSKQAAAIDDVAERAEKRARTISKVLSTEREALERATAQSGSVSVAPAIAGSMAVAGTAAAALASDAVDFSLDTDEPEADLATDTSGGDSDTVVELRRQLADAKKASTWERPVLSTEAPSLDAGLDPFDDIAPPSSSPAASVGTAAASAVAVGALAAEGNEPEAFETLELDTPAETGETLNLNRRHALDWRKFVRAANFPESEEDIETLDALYDVLTDPESASLLQCAEDTLASLADIDLYMEDFMPQMMPVSVWKNHLDGTGDGKDPIKGIHAPIEQSRIRAKLKSDSGFEHLCAKFMDRYEDMKRRMLSETDEERLVVDLSNTRTGRAYLMIADAAGRL